MKNESEVKINISPFLELLPPNKLPNPTGSGTDNAIVERMFAGVKSYASTIYGFSTSKLPLRGGPFFPTFAKYP
jgi:hypothetical protein